MARTKEEREIIANIIGKQIKAHYDALTESKKKEAKQLIKDAAPVIKEIDTLTKKFSEEIAKLNKNLPEGYNKFNSEETNINQVARALAKYKHVTNNEITEQLVLAGDQGAEILVRNIVKMFTECL